MSSGNVDNRIVQMEFDNKQFESGVKETMSTLDRLKQALKLDNVSDGFDKLGKASDKVAKSMKKTGQDGANAFSQLSNQIDSLGSKLDGLVSRFSVVGEAVHRLQSAFLSTVKDLTVGQISKGFSKYAEVSEAVSTLMGTLGKSAKSDIYEAVEELNRYSDATSFDLSNMTQNLSMFVSAGQDLDKSTEAIKGIGNAAATAGVSVEKTRLIMKNFSDAMGAGSMRLQDWKSLEILGFASKPIREAFIKTAQEMENGTVTKDGYVIDSKGKKTKFQVNYGNFRESLKYDWLNAEVIMRTLHKYQDLGDDFGRAAYDAAKTARTYKEAMDAVADAVSTGWLHVFERIFGDVDEASALWTSFSDTLIVRLSDPFFEWIDNILLEWKEGGGREKLIRIFSEIAAMLFGLETELEDGTVVVNQNILSSIIEAWRNVFGELTGAKLLGYTDKVMMAMILLHKWMDVKDYRGYTVFDKIRAGFEGLFNVWGIVLQMKRGIGAFNRSLGMQLLPTVEAILGLLPDINVQLGRLHKWLKDTKFFTKLGKKLADIFKPFTSRLPGVINKTFDWLMKGINFLTTNETVGKIANSWFTFFDTFLTSIPNIIEGIFSLGSSLKEMFVNSSEYQKLSEIYDKYIKPLGKDFFEFSKIVADSLTGFLTFDTSGITSFWERLKARFTSLGSISEWLSAEWEKLKQMFPSLLDLEKAWNETKIPEKLQKLSDLLGKVFEALFGGDTTDTTSICEKLSRRFSAAWDLIQPVIQTKFEQLKTWITEKATALWTDISTKFSELANPIFAVPIAGFAAAVFSIIQKLTQPNAATSVAQGLAGSATSTVIGLFGAAATAAYLASKIKPEHVEKVVAWYDKLKAKVKEIAEADNPFEVIVQTIRNFTDKLKKAVNDFFAGTGETENEEGGNFFSNIVAWIVQKWEEAKAKLEAFWNGLPDWFSRFFKGAWQSLTSKLSGRAQGNGTVTFFDQLVDEISKYTEPLKEAWAKFKEVATPIFEDVKNFVHRLFTRDVSTLGEDAGIGDTLMATFQESLDEGGFEQTITAIDKLKEYFGKIGEKAAELWEKLKAVDWAGLAFKIKATISLVSLFLGLLTAYNFSSAVKKLAKAKLGHDTIGTTIQKIGAAIASVASAFYLIGTLKTDQINAAKSAITGITVALGLLTVLTGVMTFVLGRGTMKDATSGMLKVAGAITLVAAAIYGIGALYGDGTAFNKGAEIMVCIAGALLAMQLVSSLIGLIGDAAHFDDVIKIAGAMAILAVAVVILGAFNPGLIKQGELAIFGLSLAVVAMQALSALIGKYIGEPTKFASVIATAGAILLLGVAVIALGALPEDMLKRGKWAVVALAGCIAVIQATMSLLGSNTKGIAGIAGQIISFVGVILAMRVFAEVVQQIKDVDPAAMLSFAGSLSTIIVVVGLMSAVMGKLGTAALAGVGIFAAIILGLSLAFALASGLAGSGMDNVTTMLFQFAAIMRYFSDTTTGITADDAIAFVGQINGLIIDAISMVGYYGQIQQYTSMIMEVATGLRFFHFATNGIDPANAENAHAMAEEIAATVTVLKDSGIDEFPDMSTALTYFGSAIDLFNEAVSGKNLSMPEGFDSDNFKTAFEGIANAMPGDETFAVFKELASTEEGSKGDELAKFALGINAIKIALNSYAEAAKDLPVAAVTIANTKLGEIAALTASMPTTTSFSWEFIGLGSVFTSQESPLKSFAEGVTALSGGLKAYVDAANGIEKEKIEQANKTITDISNLDPPKTGKFYDFLTGEGTLDTFAKQLVVLGSGFAEYARAAGGGDKGAVDYTNVTKSVRAIRQLGSIQNMLDPQGGLMGALNGSQGQAFSSLASNMKALGTGIADFCREISGNGVDFKNSQAAVDVIANLGNIQNSLKETGGLKGLLSGEVQLGNFSDQLKLLGKGIKGFAGELEGTNFDTAVVGRAISYLNSFASIQAKIKDPQDLNIDGLARVAESAATSLVNINSKFSGDFNFDTTNLDLMKTYLNSFADIAGRIKDWGAAGNLDLGTFGNQIKNFFEEVALVATESNMFSTWYSDEKLKAVTDGITKPFEAIKEAMNSISTTDTEGAGSSITTAITNVLDTGVTTIEGKQAEFKGAAEKLIEGLQNGVSEGSIIEQAAAVASEGAGDSGARSAYDAFESAGDYLVQGLAAGMGHIEPAVSAARTMARKVLQAMRDELAIKSPSKETEEIGGYTGEGYAIGLEKSEGTVTNAGNEMLDGLLKDVLGEDLYKQLNQAGEKAGSTVTASVETGAKKSGGLNWGKIGLAIVRGDSAEKIIADNIGDVVGNIDLQGITTQLGEKIAGIDPQKITDGISTFIGNAGGAITPETLATALGVDPSLLSTVVDSTLFTSEQKTAATETVKQEMGEVVANGVQETESKVDSFMNETMRWLQGGEFTSILTGSGKEMVDSIANGFSSANINTEASNLAKEAAGEAGVRSAYNDFVSAGEYLVQGVAAGLAHNEPAVSAAKSMARKVLQAMRDAMAIKSPSKITAEYGMYLNEGLALGIEKYGHMANTAAGNVAKLVLSTMDSTINNHDYTIGITPVVDSSNISSYANTLRGFRSEWDMLDAMRMSKVSRVAESMDVNVNDRYANTIESFRSEIADLGDRITSMRVVMDSGTIVGELAPGMDMALGRRANYNTRRIS